MILMDLLIVFTVAGAAVYLFERLRLPPVAGLLSAGVLVGPSSLGLVHEVENVHLLAEVGVVVLLFTVGLEFSLTRVLAMGRLMGQLGLPQVLICVGVTAAATAGHFGNFNQALFAGMLVAMSSTAVVLRVLSERSELDAPHGRAVVAVLLLQDLLVVVAVLAVPLLAPQPAEGLSLWRSLLVGVGAVAAILLAGKYLLPGLLYQVVRTRNRELFLIAVCVVCLGTATLTGAVGLSLALGAFLAGLTLSESEYGHQTLAEVLPFRDTLSSLFFVSVGMLLDVRFVRDHLGTVLLAVVVLLAVKFLAAAAPAALFRYPLRTTLLVGLSLAQVGEFSFVLAVSGLQHKLLTPQQYQTFLAAAVITMALTPFLIAAGPRLAERLTASGRLRRWLRHVEADPGEEPRHLHGHVVIAGFGFNGRNLAAGLRDLGIPYVALEMNPVAVRKLRRHGESILYGDCTRTEVLRHAGVARARVFVVAISDPASTRRAVHLARQLNPNIRVIVRTRYRDEIRELRKLGADQIVPEEFETSVEIFGRVLREFEVSGGVIRRLAEKIRCDHYVAFDDQGAGRVPLRLPEEVLSAADMEVVSLGPDSAANGRTIGELRLRKQTGASVIAVRRGKELLVNPDADCRLQDGDAVVLLGGQEQLAAALAALGPSAKG